MNEQGNEKKLVEGEDFYYTPEGYKCFTSNYHLKRGYCCKSGCRHCPYGFDKKTGETKKYKFLRIQFAILQIDFHFTIRPVPLPIWQHKIHKQHF